MNFNSTIVYPYVIAMSLALIGLFLSKQTISIELLKRTNPVLLSIFVDSIPHTMASLNYEAHYILGEFITVAQSFRLRKRYKNLNAKILTERFTAIKTTQIIPKSHFSLAGGASIPISHCKLII